MTAKRNGPAGFLSSRWKAEVRRLYAVATGFRFLDESRFPYLYRLVSQRRHLTVLHVRGGIGVTAYDGQQARFIAKAFIDQAQQRPRLQRCQRDFDAECSQIRRRNWSRRSVSASRLLGAGISGSSSIGSSRARRRKWSATTFRAMAKSQVENAARSWRC